MKTKIIGIIILWIISIILGIMWFFLLQSTLIGSIFFILLFILISRHTIIQIIKYKNTIIIKKMITGNIPYIKKTYTIKKIEKWFFFDRFSDAEAGGINFHDIKDNIKNIILHPIRSIFGINFIFWIDDKNPKFIKNNAYTRKVILNEFDKNPIIFAYNIEDIPKKTLKIIEFENSKSFLKEFVMKYIKIGDKITLMHNSKNPNIFYPEDPLKKQRNLIKNSDI